MMNATTKTPPRRLGRRAFLGGLGAACLAPGFARLLSGGARAAAPAALASRLLVVFSPNGTIHDRWRPDGEGASFTFPAGSILEPLAPWRHRLVVCDGLDFFNADNHEGGMAAMLTNGGGLNTETRGRSLDQHVAAHIGAASRFASLELGVQTSAWGGGTQTRMSYSGPGAFVTPDDNPRRVFDRLFGAALGANADRRAALRQSILDLHRDELLDLHARLGRPEQLKLEEHLESLRALERASADPGLACAPGAPPADLATYDNDRFPALTAAQIDLAATALACDLTRVASLQLAHTVAPTVCTWLDLSDGHHSLSHSADSDARGVADFVAAERWFTAQFAALLDALDARPDPDAPDSDRTLLDATLVVWAKELGDSRLHTCRSVPFVLAGGSCFAEGRYHRFGGVPHAHLLVSICQALGVPAATFGDPAAGAGPLAGLT